MKRAITILGACVVGLTACEDDAVTPQGAVTVVGGTSQVIDSGGAPDSSAGSPSMMTSKGGAANSGGTAMSDGGMVGESGAPPASAGGPDIVADAGAGGMPGAAGETNVAGEASGGAPVVEACQVGVPVPTQCKGTLLLNEAPTLHAGWPASAITGSPYSALIGWFNGDDKPDLAITSSANKLSIFPGLGNGTFDAPIDTDIPAEAQRSVSGYINADQYLDVVTSNYYDSTLSVLLGKGDGSFEPPVTYKPGFKPLGLALGLLNGDDRPEIVVANFANSSISIFVNKGDGSFNANPNTAYGGSNSTGIVIGDFNSDAKNDVIIAGYTGVTYMQGKGDGNIQYVDQKSPAYFSACTGPYSIVTSGYFNGDNVLDIATSCPNAGGITVLIAKGDGTFEPYVSYAVGVGTLGTRGLGAGDFDGDGNTDLLVGVATTDGKGYQTASVLYGNGDGTFQDAVDYLGGLKTVQLAVGDLNADGQDDAVLVNNSVSASHSSGDFGLLLSDGEGDLMSPTVIRTPVDSRAVATLDLNGDCNLDFAVANRKSKSISLMLTNADGSYQPVTELKLSNMPELILLGDKNADGVPDIDVAGASGVDRLLGDGNGGFGTPIPRGGNSDVRMLEQGDFNNDGMLDIVEQSYANDGCVSLNLGGTDTWLGCYGKTTQVRGLALGDFNADKKLDMALAQNTDSQLAVYFGKGDGTFESPQYSTGDAALGGIFPGDVDGDHDIDIVSLGDDGVRVYFNDGEGAFTRSDTAYPYTGYTGGGVSLVDMNGDGSLDVVSASWLSDEVGIFFNDGKGGFGVEQNYPVGGQPWRLASGDFDRDGNQDIAVAGDLGTLTLLERSGCLP